MKMQVIRAATCYTVYNYVLPGIAVLWVE